MQSPPKGPRRRVRPFLAPHALPQSSRLGVSQPGLPSPRWPFAVAGRGLRALALSGLLGLGGCELGANFGDLGESLLDPDVQSIDAPGKRWVAGPHFDLSVLEGQGGKRYVGARNAESEFLLIDFEKENYCRAGKVSGYDKEAVFAPSRPPLVPLLVERAAGEGLALTFTTFECERSAFSVPVAGQAGRVIENLPGGSGTGMLVKTPDGGLVLVDPWEQTTERLAESVRREDPASAFGHYLWVDRGVIVISDDNLVPVTFLGRRVTAVSASAEARELAYIEAGDNAGDDAVGGTLYTVDAFADAMPAEVASDVCQMGYLTLSRRRQLYYLTCAERQLALRDVETGAVRIIDENVAGAPSVRSLSGQSVLTYRTTESHDAVVGTLWLVNGSQPKVAVAENTRIGPSTVTGGGGLLTVLDWNTSGGRLVEWRPDALTEVAQGVVELNPLGRLANDDLTLLGNFDGETGDLLRLRADLTTEVLAQRVPRGSANADAFLANFDNEAGDLMLLDRRDGSSQPLGTRVNRGAFIFTQQFRAVLMLADRDPDSRTNTLRMHLLRAQHDYVLHDGVTEAREVAFPSPGILYNVVTGEDAGVWFAKTL